MQRSRVGFVSSKQTTQDQANRAKLREILELAKRITIETNGPASVREDADRIHSIAVELLVEN
jgi:hypothetical protein